MSEHVRRPTDHARQRVAPASVRHRAHLIRAALAGALAVGGLGSGAVAAPPAEAEEAAADRIEAVDTFVTEQMRRLHIPGLALALIENGRIVHERGYGIADTGGRAVTPHTPFILASTSKQLTGIAVQQLVQAGRIELDAPVSRYLPVFQTADDAHRSITVRQLLGQVSGFSVKQGRETLALDGGPDDTLEVNARRLAREPLTREPGAAFEYSNANYDLLGYLVEKVSGMPYAEYLQQRVLDPLGMEDSYTSKADAERAGLADGFYPWFGVASLPTPATYPRSDLPSYGVIASAHDLATVVLAQLGDVPVGQSDVDAQLLAATRMPLSRPNEYNQYASGWWIHRFWPAQTEGDPNNPSLPMMYEHIGDAATYNSFVGYVPELGFGMVMTANAADNVVGSRWRNFVFDTMRVAVGTEPRMADPNEDLVRQFARPLYGLAILLQILTVIWSLRSRRRRVAIGLAALVNAGVLSLMLIYAPVSSDAPLSNLLRSSPDLGLMTVLAVLVTAGWLVLLLPRAVAYWRDRTRQGAGATAAGAGSA